MLSLSLAYLSILIGHCSPHSQTIIYDVSLPLDEIQAPREAVKSTAIALVRQDSVFLPGTTIGATHWVAYAMTKGMADHLCPSVHWLIHLSQAASVLFRDPVAIVLCCSCLRRFPCRPRSQTWLSLATD